jgi:zinc protease
MNTAWTEVTVKRSIPLPLGPRDGDAAPRTALAGGQGVPGVGHVTLASALAFAAVLGCANGPARSPAAQTKAPSLAVTASTPASTTATIGHPGAAGGSANPAGPWAPTVQMRVGPEEPFRARPPEPGSVRPLRVPSIRTTHLKNGITVLLAEQHALPLVDVAWVVDAGAEHQATHQAGLAGLVASMLDEGTTKHDAISLADALDTLGAALHAQADHDAVVIQLESLRRTFTSALPLAAETLLTPIFPQKDLDRLRTERLTTILQQRDLPRVVSQNALMAALYGAQHPYGVPLIGTEPSVKATTVADLVSFWKQRYRPDRAQLVVVGDITLDEALPLLEQSIGRWRTAAVKPASVAAPRLTPPQPKVLLIDKPGAPQTELRVGARGLTRTSGDYYAVEVMNAVLGGMASSRLFTNLRQKHGYTYGVYSSFDCRKGPGPFVAGGAIRTDVTVPALTELLGELKRIREQPVDADELARAKSSLIRALPSRFEDARATAAAIAELVVYRLPLDYYNQYARAVEAITPAEVQRVARTYLDLDHLAVVLVGDKQTIEKPLRQAAKGLGIGPIEVQ